MMHASQLPTLVLSTLIAWTVACPLHRGGAPDTSYHSAVNERRSTPKELARTAIHDVRVFDGDQFTAPTKVCMDGGWIVDTAGCTDPDATINGTGKFLIPGLIDSHLHLTDVQSLEYFTSYGCTTAFHMNCANYTQCHLNANQEGLADSLWAGMSAVGNGSHHASTAPNRPKDTLIYPDTDVVEFVQYQFNNGSDYHKITAEVNDPSLEQQIQMVQTAHERYGKQTMTHASDIEAYKQAIASVTDGIQHVPDDGVLDDSTIQQILRQGQFVTPTINVFEFAYRSQTLQGYFAVEPGSNRTLEHAETNAKLLYAAGVPLIAGTDSVGTLTMNGSSVAVPWGLTLHYELQDLVHMVGMTPAEAINAATREAAKWHRVPDRGSIEVQKRADLLMLNSDPLVNITNTLDVSKVWVAGIEVDRVPIPANWTGPNPALSPA